MKGILYGSTTRDPGIGKNSVLCNVIYSYFCFDLHCFPFFSASFLEPCATCERLVEKKMFSGEKGYKIKIKIKTFKQFAIQTQYH